MQAINAVTISGNLGRDAESRTTRTGKQVVTFSMAVNMPKRDGDGWTTKANWIRVVWYGPEAGDRAPLLVKGAGVVVHGSLNENTWEGRDGNKRRDVEVVAKQVAIMGGVKNDDQNDDRTDGTPDVWDEDIPF